MFNFNCLLPILLNINGRLRCLSMQRPYNLPDRDPQQASYDLPPYAGFQQFPLHASEIFGTLKDSSATYVPPSAYHQSNLHKTVDSLSIVSKKNFFSFHLLPAFRANLPRNLSLPHLIKFEFSARSQASECEQIQFSRAISLPPHSNEFESSSRF